jgi:MFS family permease
MTNYRLLTTAGSLAFIATGITSPLMSLFLESLGASYFQISLVLTSFVATLLICNYLWGRLSDRVGRRKPFVVGGLIGGALAYLLLAWAPTLASAWVTRIMEGVALAAYSTLGLAMIGDALEVEDPKHKGRRMGLYRGLGSLAFAAGSVAGGRLADSFSISSAFHLCAIAYAAAACVALFVRDRPPRTVAAPVVAVQAVARPGGAVAMLPAAFLAGVVLWTAAHMASASMWPNYMRQLGYSTTVLTSLWGLAALIEMPAMVVLGAISDRIGRTAVLITGGLLIALVNTGYAWVAYLLPALLTIQVIRGVGFAAYTGSAMTFTSELGGKARGGASGLYYTAGAAGQLLGTFFGGAVAQMAGFPAMYMTVAALALGSGAAFWALHLRTPFTRILASSQLAERKP